VELAGVFNALGTKTSIVLRHDHALRSFDRLISEQLSQELTAAGVSLHTNAVVARVEPLAGSDASNPSYRIVTKDGRELGPFERVFFTAGRVANTRMGIDTTGTGCCAGVIAHWCVIPLGAVTCIRQVSSWTLKVTSPWTRIKTPVCRICMR